jgi:hypothetical protein
MSGSLGTGGDGTMDDEPHARLVTAHSIAETQWAEILPVPRSMLGTDCATYFSS